MLITTGWNWSVKLFLLTVMLKLRLNTFNFNFSQMKNLFNINSSYTTVSYLRCWIESLVNFKLRMPIWNIAHSSFGSKALIKFFVLHCFLHVQQAEEIVTLPRGVSNDFWWILQENSWHWCVLLEVSSFFVSFSFSSSF